MRSNIILLSGINVDVYCLWKGTLMGNALVLCFGRNPLLAVTRSELLESEGYSVISVTTEIELAKKIVCIDFDLVVFCHTAPQDAKIRSAAIIRQYSATTPILALAVTKSEQHEYADATVMREPSLILTAIRELLAKSEDHAGRPDSAAADS